jgi:hypothetical protein
VINDIVAARAISAEPLPTRWKPVDLACQHAEGEIIVRSKLIRSRETAAVCISEAISYHVLTALGMRVPDSHAVIVGAEFAEEVTRQYTFEPPIRPGRHWGTTYLSNRVQEVEFDITHVPYLRTPTDIFRLFLCDILLGNPDRLTHGNLLLGESGSGGSGLEVIAIDHSDCFNHPSCMLDAKRLKQASSLAIAGWLPGTEGVVLEQNRSFPGEEIERVTALATTLCESPQHVPEEWYHHAGVDPADLEMFLKTRVEDLPVLARLDYWEGLFDAIGGGHVLRF